MKYEICEEVLNKRKAKEIVPFLKEQLKHLPKQKYLKITDTYNVMVYYEEKRAFLDKLEVIFGIWYYPPKKLKIRLWEGRVLSVEVYDKDFQELAETVAKKYKAESLTLCYEGASL